MPRSFQFPRGKKFAFTIVDDTDVATVTNVKPVYTLLRNLGMRTTKTVWPLAYSGESNFTGSQTLEDADYLEFVRELQQWGFEVTWHSAAMESSPRAKVVAGLERFRTLLGHYPRVHVSHAENRENPYWGSHRVDMGVLRLLLTRAGHPPADHFVGHVPDSEYWWGDYCERHIEYGRNLTFNSINLASVNPTMPYRDPQRPLIQRWFSSSDAEDARAFTWLLRSANQDRLEAEGGFCIVATHFGKAFAPDGCLDPSVKSSLEEMAGRPGWFPPVGELLDWLQQQGGADELPRAEWRRMQVRFALDAMRRRMDRMLGRK